MSANMTTDMGQLKKAIHDWQCLTHVHFEIDTAPYIAKHTTAFNDSISTIAVGDLLNYSTVARTRQFTNSCNGLNPTNLTVGETDLIINLRLINKIVFDTTPGYSIPKGNHDGYHNILHELGHAHSLGHINDFTKIMFYGSDTGGISAANRVINLTLDAPAYDGGYGD